MNRTKVADLIEQHFRKHRYESFTVQDLLAAFPETKVEAVRNAVKHLSKDRIIKSTGMVRFRSEIPQPVPIPDAYCLTLTIGK